MPIATAKRSFENIPHISKSYFIRNFWSAASYPRILTLYKIEGGTFGTKETFEGEGNTFFKVVLWEIVGITVPWELGDNCVVLGDFTYVISCNSHDIPERYVLLFSSFNKIEN